MRTKKSRLPEKFDFGAITIKPECSTAAPGWRTTYKITEVYFEKGCAVSGKVIRTVRLIDPLGQHTGTGRYCTTMAKRRCRRWNLPLHDEAIAYREKQSLPMRYRHRLENDHRLSGGLDVLLRESSSWPHLPPWMARLAKQFPDQVLTWRAFGKR